MPLGPYPEHIRQSTSPLSSEVSGLKTELGPEETRAKHDSLWGDGDKIGALELALGRDINTNEVKDNPIYQTVISAETSQEAFGAASVIKTIEELHDEKSE